MDNGLLLGSLNRTHKYSFSINWLNLLLYNYNDCLIFTPAVHIDEDSCWSHLFCSSSLASSSSSSGLKFSESAGEAAGADSNASWEEESGLRIGLPVDGGSVSMPGGEERHSSWGGAPLKPSLSGLPLGIDMAVTVEGDGWSGVGEVRGSPSSVSQAIAWLATWLAVEPIWSEVFEPVMDLEKAQ